MLLPIIPVVWFLNRKALYALQGGIYDKRVLFIAPFVGLH